jgi:hypothetical protein
VSMSYTQCQCGIGTSSSANGLCKAAVTRFVVLRPTNTSFALAVCEEHYALIQREKIQDLTEQEYLIYQVHDE